MTAPERVRSSERFTSEEFEALLDAARRIESGQDRETAGHSMDCDYGHDVIEELQEALAARACQRGMVEGARLVQAAVVAEADTWGEPKVAAVVAVSREALAKIENGGPS